MTDTQLAELIEIAADRHALGPSGDRTYQVGVSYTRTSDYKAGAQAWLEIGKLLGIAKMAESHAMKEAFEDEARQAIAKLTEERNPRGQQHE